MDSEKVRDGGLNVENSVGKQITHTLANVSVSLQQVVGQAGVPPKTFRELQFWRVSL